MGCEPYEHELRPEFKPQLSTLTTLCPSTTSFFWAIVSLLRKHIYRQYLPIGLFGWLKEKMYVWRMLTYHYLEPLPILYPSKIACEPRQVRFSVTTNNLQLSCSPFLLHSLQTTSLQTSFWGAAPKVSAQHFSSFDLMALLLQDMLPQHPTEQKAEEPSATGDMKMETETAVMHLHTQEGQRQPGATRNGKSPGRIPSKSSAETGLCWHTEFRLVPFRTVRECLLLGQAAQFVVICCSCPKKSVCIWRPASMAMS